MADPFRNAHEWPPLGPSTSVQGNNQRASRKLSQIIPPAGGESTGSNNRQRQQQPPPQRNRQRGGHQDLVARAEQAAIAAHKEALLVEESVTVWKIVEKMLSILKLDSLDSWGLRIQEIPYLYKIILLEGKLNAFIHCYVAVRRIATLYDLSAEFCRQEGVEDFERLELGPLVRHPLIVHYFAPSKDTITAFKITTEQIIGYLSNFLYTCHGKDIQVEEFMFYVAKKQKVSSSELLCVRIHSLRMHICLLQRIKKVEKDLANKLEAEIDKKKEIERKNKASELQSKIISDQLNLSINNKLAATECGPKHIRFERDSNLDDDRVLGSEEASMAYAKKSKTDQQFQKSSGSCLYPLAAEEQEQLRNHPSTEKLVVTSSDNDEDLGGAKSQNVSKGKRKAGVHVKDVQLTDDELIIFLASWKNICCEKSVSKVFKIMVEFHWLMGKEGQKASKKNMNRLNRFFTMQPAIGLLNVAVCSMKMGLWDRFLELDKQEGIMNEYAYARAATQIQSLEEETRIPVTKTDHQFQKSSGSCAYPLAAEEQAQLRNHPSTDKFVVVYSDNEEDRGGAKSQNVSRKKRKAGVHVKDVQLTDDELIIFLAAWKNICCEKSVSEVFKTMVELYCVMGKEGQKASKRNMNKLNRLFRMEPAIGLLHVAVSSMKMGLWDSFLELHKQEGTVTKDAYSREATQVQSLKEETHIPVTKTGLSTHDVVQQVIKFFEVDFIDNAQEGELAMEEHFVMLRKLWHCEKWLVKQFSVQDFACLGFGDFLNFLIDQLSELPQKIIKILTLPRYRESPVVVYIAKNQLLDFLSQAAWDLGDHTMLTKEEIIVLLQKQFPLLSFELSDNHSIEEILNCIRNFQSPSQQRKIGYSAALLARSSINEQSRLRSHVGKWSTESVQTAGAFGHITSSDALKYLLKAPMLSDLEEWSHWDHVFAPKLGPLMNWLEKEATTNNLVFLVTRSGKMLRIDGLASLDEFLAAAVKGWAKQTAIQFVSIVSLYGGTHHAPIELMKSHTGWAINALVKNSVERFEHAGLLDMAKLDSCINCQKSRLRERNFGNDSCHAAVLRESKISVEMAPKDYAEKSQKIEKSNQAIRVAARFILDCLLYVPPEFRTFAAQIFMSGLGTVSGDPSQIILHECVVSDERLMLHEIGLSIDIIEWIKDYEVFSLDASHADISLIEHQEARSDVQNHGQHDKECESGINRLEGIHCLDLNSVERKGKELNELQSKNLNDHRAVLANPKDCVISMPESEGLLSYGLVQISDRSREEDAKRIIEEIRREEFGLDLELQFNETNLLRKQHVRLGRALHCLSQELYSQDSHFLLELVQNADDNLYPAYTEPTLAFVLQSNRVLVLNNELGFTAKDIRALCDVGNSTKKSSTAGYIGHKGIGFKSVFRVTDSPEIHSNGFHVKFDITEGELGFILPTLVAPVCNLDSFSQELHDKNDNLEESVWNTCIVLPFKASFLEGTGMRSWVSKFSDFHPSLLLFLHRLRCIKIRDSLTNSLKIMRREDIGNGLVKVSHGKESTTWLVASRTLNAGTLRPGIQTTEIGMGFTLCEDKNGEYGPYLEQQPVFAFLPLRAYGLKFILQGDFILPSSREEVDGDSAWNQWLLSEFPDLFVNKAVSFRGLPCCQSNPGKAVTLYMSFVPLVREVLGFFSPLPGMILSKLRSSPCLPLEGKDKQWVLPVKVLRGWSDQIRTLLPDDLLNNHLGLGYLHRDVHLSDPLAAALGMHAYGPQILLEIMKSLCNRRDALRVLGLNWLGSWLGAFYDCLRFRPTGLEAYFEGKQEADCLSDLRQIPFVPLSDGSYTSLLEGPIWLPCEATEVGLDVHTLKNFPRLYSELRTVHSALFFASTTAGSVMVRGDLDAIVRMLRCVGVGQLSAHEIVMTHILQAMSTAECMTKDKLSLTEYLAFTMLHLQSNCSLCYLERSKLILELQKKAVIITNNGYKRASSEPLHFSREFGNPIDMRKILAGTNVGWNEIDNVYLQFFSSEEQPLYLSQWRMFFKELGVTDFVHVLNVDKKVEDKSSSIWKDLTWDGFANAVGWTVNDWESPELVDILTALTSSSTNIEQCSCLLEVLDHVWDDIFGAKKAIYWSGSPGERKGKCTETSYVLEIRRHRWVKSTLDGKLHFPTDLFFECDATKSILGSYAPYASLQVNNRKLVADIGFRTQVVVKDALNLLYEWSKSERIFKARTYQMGRLYSFLWTRMDTCMEKVAAHFKANSSIFVPYVDESNCDDIAEGIFLSLDQVYWRDPTGCLELLKKGTTSSAKFIVADKTCLRSLSQIYPSLQTFFVNGCCVQESPDFDGYVRILQLLSRIARPSQAYKEVLQVLYKWAEDVESERVDSKEVFRWKDCLHDLDCSVLPSIQDKWVSLHQNFGLVCWCDDVELGKQFRHCHGVYFLCLHAEGKFGKMKGKDNVPYKVITLMHALGVPSLSEVVVREAIYYGLQDSKQKLSFINWILPYAQRYLYRMHPDVYCAVKDNIFCNQSNRLCILVVERVFYRHTLQGCHSASNESHECSCLLEGNTLYVSQEAEYSAIHSELSRLFFEGSLNLQLANFLHLITIMSESGSTEEQTESFILNVQDIPKLPEEEATWFCEHRDQSATHVIPPSPSIPEDSLVTKKVQKFCADSSWPPRTWFGAPKSRDEVQPQAAVSGINQDEVPHDSKTESDIDMRKIERGGESSIASKDDIGSSLENTDVAIYSQKMSVSGEMDVSMSSAFTKRNKLCWGVPDDEQQKLSGRLGEFFVHKYLIEKYGPTSVNWVNEEEETGLPFDMILSKQDGKKEFIEVKATKSVNKDWFEITHQEWEFASKNIDCFTIIRVFLADVQSVKLVVLENPVKLRQQNLIKLVILTPTNLPEFTFIPLE